MTVVEFERGAQVLMRLPEVGDWDFNTDGIQLDQSRPPFCDVTADDWHMYAPSVIAEARRRLEGCMDAITAYAILVDIGFRVKWPDPARLQEIEVVYRKLMEDKALKFNDVSLKIEPEMGEGRQPTGYYILSR